VFILLPLRVNELDVVLDPIENANQVVVATKYFCSCDGVMPTRLSAAKFIETTTRRPQFLFIFTLRLSFVPHNFQLPMYSTSFHFLC
jgi:hypothetical protein